MYFPIISITSISYEHHIIIFPSHFLGLWESFGVPAFGQHSSARKISSNSASSAWPAARPRFRDVEDVGQEVSARRRGGWEEGCKCSWGWCSVMFHDVPWLDDHANIFSYNIISYILIIMIINHDYLTILNSAIDCHDYI